MLTLEQIVSFCNQHDYDVRKSRNARWIDQKCTPDVLWSISDFVLNYVDTVNEQFTVANIWKSEYAKQTIAETYSKPGTDEKAAEREYDKVFSQPLSLLCYAGVIRDIAPGKRHLYVIENRDVLEYIARNDIYSLRFLQCYIEKVLKDSGLFPVFEDFFENQDNAHYSAMKKAFIDFYHAYTNVRGEYEPKRIFTKVVNPLSFKYNKKGSEDGRMSKNVIVRSDMMYNQDNFRDVYGGKPKGVTRQEWLALHPEIDRRDGYFEQMLNRAKLTLQKHIVEYRAGISEMTQYIADENDSAPATQCHHIFPKHDFPEIMHYIENLIAITPNQHFLQAHPNNNTRLIDVGVQKILLVAKTYSIEANLTNELEEDIYSFSDYLYVLRVGWDDESVLEIAQNDFVDVIHAINAHY